MVGNKGQNQLGSILKNIRYDVHVDRELIRWLYFTFEIQENANLCPIINFEVIKEEEKIGTAIFRDKQFVSFNCNRMIKL